MLHAWNGIRLQTGELAPRSCPLCQLAAGKTRQDNPGKGRNFNVSKGVKARNSMVAEGNTSFPQRMKVSPRSDTCWGQRCRLSPDLELILSVLAKGAMEGCSARRSLFWQLGKERTWGWMLSGYHNAKCGLGRQHQDLGTYEKRKLWGPTPTYWTTISKGEAQQF